MGVRDRPRASGGCRRTFCPRARPAVLEPSRSRTSRVLGDRAGRAVRAQPQREGAAVRQPFPIFAPEPGSPPPVAEDRRQSGAVRTTVRALSAAPTVLRAAWHDAQLCCAAFDEVVLPLVAAETPKGPERDRLGAALRAWSAKGGHMVAACCRAAGRRFTGEHAAVSALGCAFARLYDDLLDEPGRTGFAERAGRLFAGRPWTPRDPLEALAGALFSTLEQRLGRPPGDVLYTALATVHRYQCRSARQAAPDVTLAELEEITYGKGGATMVVLFALARPGMTAAEAAAVAELGAALQLCDDHHDRARDAMLGIATLPGTGACGRAELRARLAAAEAGLANLYGSRPARRLLDEAHVFLLLSEIGRAASGLRRPAPATAPTRPLVALLRRGPAAVVTAPGGSR